MTTHDELAYSVAVETIAAIRGGSGPWGSIFSTECHLTASREWPVPDFVIRDDGKDITAAAEFKPPAQTKREYLTGLGQAIAYTRDFDYSLLIVPSIADDGYAIADHLASILEMPDYGNAPVALLRYDPTTISSSSAGARIGKFFAQRSGSPPTKVSVSGSFYAKWREISPEEMGRFLRHLYEESHTPTSAGGSIRDRAWAHLWADIQAGKLHHWGGGVRHYGNTNAIRNGCMKNYRNFINHIGWMETSGLLTHSGLEALHRVHIYGDKSIVFTNYIARSLLLGGKHLILINSINEFQNEWLLSIGPFEDEASWLQGIERFLESKGLLERNSGRHAAAQEGSARQFLKAEKQIWRQLKIILPRGGRVYHPGRGFVFNWSRITDLVR